MSISPLVLKNPEMLFGDNLHPGLKMKLIEDFNTVPSLGFITVSKIVSNIWNRNDISRSMNKCLDNTDIVQCESNFIEIANEVTAVVQSIEDISTDLVDNLKDLVKPIGKQIYEMLLFIKFSLSFRNVGQLPVIYWTSYGSVDTKRVEKLLVQDSRHDLGFRFILACNNCFKENIEELFPLLSKLQKTTYKKVKNNRELLSYWTHNMSGDLFSFKKLFARCNKHMKEHDYSAHQFAFLYTLLTGNKSGMEYFMNTLPREDYELVLTNHLEFVTQEYGKRTILPYGLCFRPDSHYEDAMYFLLMKLNKSNRPFLRRDPFYILRLLINYPFFGVFSKYVKILIHDLNWNHISWLLSEIIKYEELKMPSFGLDLFNDLWRVCPRAAQVKIKNSSDNSYWYSGDELSLLLRRITEAEQSWLSTSDSDA